MKKTIKALCAVLTALCCGIFSVCIEFDKQLPEEFTVYRNESFSLNDFNTISFNNQSEKEIKVNSDLHGNTADGNLMFLNIIPIKQVNVRTIEKKYVIPCGNIFGIKFHTKGVVVIQCNDISVNGNMHNPGTESGLQIGDTIIKINGNEITSCTDMQIAVEKSDGKPLQIEYDRQGEYGCTYLTAIDTSGFGEYKAGLWIRDSCAGLGTMTFYDPQTNCFASLGHGICDSDTGELLPLDRAVITEAEIGSITKGSNGIPGSINGYFANDTEAGQAIINNETGLYGVLNEPSAQFEPVEIANIQEIKKGSAQILCTLDEDGAKYYTVEITHVDYDEKNKTKNLQITATDERLLQKTGGIVQGMSGSPILQNGKLVGAVTHVLVTNSAKGYGIFAQNMYDEIEKKLN